MQLSGVDHLGLTVTDLDRATSWYCDHLDFEPFVRYSREDIGAEVQVLGRRDTSLRLSLRCFASGGRDPFSELHVGMDHVAFGVADDSVLSAWHARLEEGGVTCNRTDLRELSILAFRDPD